MRRRRRRHEPVERSHSPLLLGGLFLLVPALALVNILLSAQVAHLGFRISEVDAAKAALLDQTQDLEQEIYQHSALTDIYQQAEVMGFDNQSEYQSVERNLPVALESGE